MIVLPQGRAAMYHASASVGFSNVVQLAHFDGSNGSTTFTNSCPRGNTMTSATSSISTTQSKFGGASMRNPTSSSGVGAASHSDYAMGTGDFTIEWWQRIDSTALDFNGVKIFFDTRDSSLASPGTMAVYSGVVGKIAYGATGSERILSGAGALVALTWQHIAVCKASGSTRLFVDGTQVGSTFTDSENYTQSIFRIGLAGNGGGACVGYFDEFRMTKGLGRYTANFTPPIAAFPNS